MDGGVRGIQRPTRFLHDGVMTIIEATTEPDSLTAPVARRSHEKQERRIRRVIARKSFAVLATTSPAGRSHSAGIIYSAAEGDLWVHTMAASRKARNVAENPHVGLCIVYRRLPVGPPFTVHFQATAELVDLDAPEVRSLIDAGHLKSLTGHGALEMDGACFMRVRPGATIHSFGTGVPTLDLIRDPLTAGARTVRLQRNGSR